MEFVYFLGRFHVVVLHLPIGILIVAAVVDGVARWPRYQSLGAAAGFLWGAGALSAVVTVALGFMHFAEGGFDGPSARLHRSFGTGVAVLALVVWLLRRHRVAIHARVQPITTPLVLLAVTLTGHYGGNLTHGPTYLLEHAPDPLRGLLLHEPRQRKALTLGEADVFADLVDPILQRRCASCHNPDKRRGGLSLASHAELMAGGEHGIVVVAGKPEASELLRRVLLPPGEEDAMPAEGKSSLSAEQIAVVRWWIGIGAPAQGAFAGHVADPDLQRAAMQVMGLAQPPAADVRGVSAPRAADVRQIDRLVQAGFHVRQVSASDARLVVSRSSLAPASIAELKVLSEAGCDIVELNLARSGLDDTGVTLLEGLACLRRLNLSGNRLSDRGLASLQAIEALEVLYLYGNARLTDGGISTLASLPALRTVYAGGTRATRDAVRRLQGRVPVLRVELDAM